MPALEISLSAALESPGVIGAALVDAVTGLTYSASDDVSAFVDGSGVSEVIASIAEGVCLAGSGGGLESVVVTGDRWHEVVQVVPGRAPADSVALVLVLDRTQSNLALVLRDAAGLAGSVLA